jgi:hypothetical protein
MKMSEASHYQSYLLRLWRDNARDAWRASLQSTASEEVFYFAGVEQMWAYLKAQIGDGDESDPGIVPPGVSEPGTPDGWGA